MTTVQYIGAEVFSSNPEPMTPDVLHTEAELDAVLTRPSAALVDFIRTVRSPLMVLGAGGKMGPTLAVRARRAAEAAGHPLDVVAVSRFSDEARRTWLEAHGVRTLRCDLMDRAAVRALPAATDVLYLVGQKFGTVHDPVQTWAVNTLPSAHVAEHYAGARLGILSTGNVYPLTPVDRGGSVETDALTPLGEYANACVARERIFSFFARKDGTPVVLLRLNYAVDLRYGVLLDLARKVAAGAPVDLTMGYLNCIWQGDAHDMILRSLALAAVPPVPLNVTGPDVLAVRALAGRLGALLGRAATFTGREAETALLSNPARACRLLGPPPTAPETMLRWTAHWVRTGGPTWNRPTHFEVRDGQY